MKSAQPSPGWRDAEVLKGKAATVAAVAARQGRRLLVIGADLKGADFSGRDLANVCFAESELSGSRWTGAKLRQVTFSTSSLENANFDSATIEQSQLIRSHLSGLRGQRSTWRDTVVAGAWNVDLVELQGAELTRVEWFCTADYDFCQMGIAPDFDLKGARLDGFAFHGGYAGMTLDGATITHAKATIWQLQPYAKAKVVGDVQLVADDSPRVILLSPAEWTQLQAGIVVSRSGGPDPDCGEPQGQVGKFLGSTDKNYMLPEANWVRNEMLRDCRVALEEGLTTPAEQAASVRGESACLPVRPSTNACLKKLYEARRDQLSARLAAVRPLKPGETALFVGSEVTLSSAFRRTALYAKLIPFFYDSAYQRLYVTALSGGRLALAGGVAGANGHSCSADDVQLSLRPNGWFGREDEFDHVWQNGVRISGDRADLGKEEALGGCGARAHWGAELQRLPVSEDILLKKESPPGV